MISNGGEKQFFRKSPCRSGFVSVPAALDDDGDCTAHRILQCGGSANLEFAGKHALRFSG